MHAQMGTESLVQRGRTPLFIEVVNLYQDTQKGLEGIKSPSSGDVLMMLKAERFRERLKAIVLKRMGIVLSKVNVVESSTVNMMATLGFSKQGIKQAEKDHDTPGSLLEKINALYNHRQSRMDSTDDKKKLISYLFEFTTYTSLWAIRDDDGNFFFTADELAAITLHELGHIDHFVRSAYRIYGRTLDASDIVNYIQRQPDPEVVLSLINSIKNSRYLSKDYAKLIGVVATYFKTNNALDDPIYFEHVNMLIAIVIAENAAYELFMYNNLLGGGRDQIASHSQEVDAERSADEFASRNGAYQSMVSGLGKMYSTSDNKKYLQLRQFLWRGPALVLGSAAHFLATFNIQREDVVAGYDPLMRRMTMVVETAKHAFHDLDLPDDVKDDIRQQIMNSESYIDQYNSATHRRIRAAFKEWCDNVSKLGRVLKSPIDNRLSADYGRLQDSTRALSRHPLYYLAS